jgi:glycosyltransferase involved in cell wall biosynthesis
MRVSFIIPAYNEENYIAHCLDAIAREIERATKANGNATTGASNDYEIIVVDNNSSDGTDSIVARYPNVTLLHEPRRGANRARETGFEASHGDLVAFLDADTEILPGWLARVEQEFATEKDLVCLSGPFIYYDLPRVTQFLVKLFYGLSYVVYVVNDFILRKTSVIQGGTEVVRRDALAKIGGHNVALTFYGDDADLARRLSKVGKVRFSFDFAVRSSGRRLAKEGTFTMGLRYGLNYFWITLFNRPFTMKSIEVRFPDGKSGVCEPENKVKEFAIAAGAATCLVLLAAAIAYFVKTW